MESNKLISQIVILNVYKRMQEGKYLKKLIEIGAKPHNIPVQISLDDGSLGIWRNFNQALLMDGGTDGNWRIVCHDDVTFDRNILEKMLYILQFAPKDAIISFYNPTNGDYKKCHEDGRHVIATDTNFWLQCTAYPNDIAVDFVEKANKFINGKTDDDFLIAYLQMHKRMLYVVVPSLIQHLGAFRSNFKQGGVVGKYVRYSSTYDNQFDPTTIDWEAEFADPFKAKLKRDEVKHIVNQEFFEEYGKF